jgi:hypothetical protein
MVAGEAMYVESEDFVCHALEMMPLRSIVVPLFVIGLVCHIAPGLAGADYASTSPSVPVELSWLADLQDRIIEDIKAGHPIVTSITAPLCDASIIPCGNSKLGDGNSLDTNLYWATTPGFGAWFRRRGGGWKRVESLREKATGDDDLLAVDIYHRSMKTPVAWQRRGAPKQFEVYIVVNGWRGTAIDRALATYASEMSGLVPRVYPLPGGIKLNAGGDAHVIAYSGHNRLMDLAAYQWPSPGQRAMGFIAVACMTADYMESNVPAPTRVPLLMTRDYLFANAAPVEAVLLTLLRGEGYQAMRVNAAAAYARVQDTSATRVQGAFTNPADRKWRGARH